MIINKTQYGLNQMKKKLTHSIKNCHRHQTRFLLSWIFAAIGSLVPSYAIVLSPMVWPAIIAVRTILSFWSIKEILESE